MSNIEDFPGSGPSPERQSDFDEKKIFGHQEYHTLRDKYRNNGYQVKEGEHGWTLHRGEQDTDAGWAEIVVAVREEAPRHTIESGEWITILKPSAKPREVESPEQWVQNNIIDTNDTKFDFKETDDEQD